MRQPSFQAIPFAAILVAGILVGSLTMRFVTPPPAPPPRVAGLSGPAAAGRDPAVAPDGRSIAFVSGADGALLVAPLAGGAPDTLAPGGAALPRFTADGARVVFTRTDSAGPSLWIVPAGGGAARRLLAGAADADPSPDGLWIAYVRESGTGDSTVSTVIVSDSTGRNLREVHREPGATLRAPRWSPDAKRIAVTVAARSGAPGRVLLLGIGETTRTLALPAGAREASPGAWVDAKRYVYAVHSPGDAALPVDGSSVRVHHVKRDRSYEGAWVPGAVGGIGALPGGRLVIETRADDGSSGLRLADRVPGLSRPSR